MTKLQVCIIGPKGSGKSTVVEKLQQKKEVETEEFKIHSFKVGSNHVYLAEAPYDPEKIKPTLALMAEADACLLCVPANIDLPKLGELVLLINYMKLDKGIVVITKSDTEPDRVETLKSVLPKVLAQSTLKDPEILSTSSITDEGFTELRTALTPIEPKKRQDLGPFKMPVETPVEFKSGLTNLLGIIERGSVKKFDKTLMMPWGKDFIVQEIRREGEVVEEAKAGDRVEILYKGLNKWDVHQGDVVAAENSIEKSKQIKFSIEVSQFFKDELRTDSDIQLNIGMQTLPVIVKSITKDGSSVDKAVSGDKVEVQTESKIPFAFEKGQTCILYNPNAHWKSIKVVGAGSIIEGIA